jgi:hypothetical protein
MGRCQEISIGLPQFDSILPECGAHIYAGPYLAPLVGFTCLDFQTSTELRSLVRADCRNGTETDAMEASAPSSWLGVIFHSGVDRGQPSKFSGRM